MIKEFKYSSLLLLSVALAGCGLAEPVTNTQETVDTTEPLITQVNQPINLGSDALAVDTNEIRLQLTEAIDPTTVSSLNDIEIKSYSNIQLKGTWSYNAESLELIYSIDRRDADEVVVDIPHSQQFSLAMGVNGAPTVTDLAGNKLKYQIVFATASLFDIQITASGLNSEEQIVVTHAGVETTIDENFKMYSIDSNYMENTSFQLTIATQPSDGSYCAFDNSSGKIVTRNAEVSITCSEVGPYNLVAENWNSFYELDSKFIHGGEQKALTLNDSSCSGIVASDDLEAFDWACEVVDANSIKVYSTSLKNGKGLTDLISFSSNPSWKANFVTVKKEEVTIKETVAANWWNNPVFTAPADSALSVSGGVYAAVKNGGADIQNYTIGNHAISLVISPLTTLVSITGDNAILIDGFFNSWLEGKIDANGSTLGINIVGSQNTTIKNVEISNSKNHGIQISSESSVTLDNIVSYSNGGSGIVINANKNNLNSIDNIVTVNNSEAGLIINSSNNNLRHLTSISNGGNGITIRTPKNFLSEVYTNNNSAHGISFEGAQNNIISSLTSASNNGNAIFFTEMAASSPFKNLVVNATFANNKGSAIKFGDDVEQGTIDGVEGSTFSNVLDAFNAASMCGANSCAGITTIPAATGLTTLFSYPITDASFVSPISNNSDFSLVAETYAFSNKFRTWSNNAAPTETNGSGNCSQTGIICQLLDLRLNESDTLALNKLAEPNAMLDYTYRGETTTFPSVSYLNNSREILNDNIGNDNGLCEVNETCVATKNIGSYFGHDDLNDATNATADANNIILKNYSTNGVN